MTGNSIKTILAIALLVGAASQANANDWHHIDQMALKVQRQTRLLVTEENHYRSSRHYGELLRCTNRLAAISAQVHDLALHGQCPRTLKTYVNEMDSMFHKVESLFDRIEHDAARGIGCVRGNTAHVKRLLNSIEECIYYLQDDLRYLTRASRQVRTQRLVYSNAGIYGGRGYNRPVYGSSYGHRGGYGHGRGHGHHGRSARGYDSGVGISIGGGSSRITFRF
jgi:hypothetical protein